MDLYLLEMSKFQLFPRFDASQIYISAKVDVNSKLEESEKLMNKIEKDLIAEFQSGDVSSITSIAGIRFFPAKLLRMESIYFTFL